MKVLKVFLVILYLFIYSYSVYKTEVEPQKVIWGYICALVFLIFAVWAVYEYVNSNDNKNGNS